MRRRDQSNLVLFGLALGIGGAAKALYSNASAEELGFLLLPTAWGVELASGQPFLFERGAGYVNQQLGIAIAPACSGMNFLIIAFATLVFGFLPRCEPLRQKLAWFGASALLAFAATVLVNTLRISLSLGERALVAEGWLSAAQVHRATGVGVYLGGLLALYAAVDRLFRRSPGGAKGYLVPLFFYVGLTLAIPLCRGAAARPEFATHAVVVLVAVAVAVLSILLLGQGAEKYACRSTSRAPERKLTIDGRFRRKRHTRRGGGLGAARGTEPARAGG
ncbi:MAG TPA: exosortase K [Polyangiaceae bacterium]